VGAPIRRKTPGKCFFFGRASPLFGSKSTISRFGQRFRDGQYIQFGQFLVRCSTHGASRSQPFVKVGNVPPVLHRVGATGYALFHLILTLFFCS